jgi:pilus assembly protein Flp/PilA
LVEDVGRLGVQAGDRVIIGFLGYSLCFVWKVRRRGMRKFMQQVANFLKREDGPTAVEYAVMLALIIVVCITAITTLGTNANKTFTSVGNTIGSTGS